MVGKGAACCAPSGPPASSARARRLASSTSGWSKASTPRRSPSSPVAYSHVRNSAPRSSGSLENSATTSESGRRSLTGSSTTGTTPRPSLPLVSATSCAIRSGERYAKCLEHEVAPQTRSLVDPLAATADAERHLRLVMDAVPDAIAVLDRDGRVIDLNESAKRLLAAPPNAGAGRSVFASLEADAAATVRERLAAAFRGAVQRFEVAGRREDGTKGLSARLYATVRERGAFTRVLALARDITDQKHTEHQLQQAEQRRAMGQLVSGVAHEVNNPAAIISGFAQPLLPDVVKPEQREM